MNRESRERLVTPPQWEKVGEESQAERKLVVGGG
jgi:hypothetical protein